MEGGAAVGQTQVCKAYYRRECGAQCAKWHNSWAVQITFVTSESAISPKELASFFLVWRPAFAFLNGGIGIVAFSSLEDFSGACVMTEMRFAEFSPSDRTNKKRHQDEKQRPCSVFFMTGDCQDRNCYLDHSEHALRVLNVPTSVKTKLLVEIFKEWSPRSVMKFEDGTAVICFNKVAQFKSCCAVLTKAMLKKFVPPPPPLGAAVLPIAAASAAALPTGLPPAVLPTVLPSALPPVLPASAENIAELITPLIVSAAALAPPAPKDPRLDRVAPAAANKAPSSEQILQVAEEACIELIRKELKAGTDKLSNLGSEVFSTLRKDYADAIKRRHGSFSEFLSASRKDFIVENSRVRIRIPPPLPRPAAVKSEGGGASKAPQPPNPPPPGRSFDAARPYSPTGSNPRPKVKPADAAPPSTRQSQASDYAAWAKSQAPTNRALPSNLPGMRGSSVSGQEVGYDAQQYEAAPPPPPPPAYPSHSSTYRPLPAPTYLPRSLYPQTGSAGGSYSSAAAPAAPLPPVVTPPKSASRSSRRSASPSRRSSSPFRRRSRSRSPRRRSPRRYRSSSRSRSRSPRRHRSSSRSPARYARSKRERSRSRSPRMSGGGKVRRNSRSPARGVKSIAEPLESKTPVKTRMVIVMDVPEQATSRDVTVYFSQCGSVVEARVLEGPPRIAFVHFATAEEIRSAVALSGKSFLGSRIQVVEKSVASHPVARTDSVATTTSLNEMTRQTPEESSKIMVKKEVEEFFPQVQQPKQVQQIVRPPQEHKAAFLS